jgi:predicted small metal-binding protein
MKQMTCAQMGGPETCTFVVSGATAEEMVGNGMGHVTGTHPEMAAQIKRMTPEETTQWMEEFRKKFEAAPEM